MRKNDESHGMRYSRAYKCWTHIKQRCLNKKDKNYPKYGGRGITVCQEWIDSFSKFYADMGDPPKGQSIDRIDNNAGYSKENCRWATRLEQRMNTSRSFIWVVDGAEFATALDAAKELKVSRRVIQRWCCGYKTKTNKKTYSYSPKVGCKQVPIYKKLDF